MKLADAIVVGGGPAGSTCAWKLHSAGLDVLVMDRARFPRIKLCAGWVTPKVMTDLELDPRDYPYSFMTFDELHLHWKGFSKKLHAPQHSIRRLEFDDFLLRRSGAETLQHEVRNIEVAGGDYIIDNAYRCKYLVGAGGTRCPVYRTFFRSVNPRNYRLQTATYEQEIPYRWDHATCHLWFFDGGLPGYAWYVPKANGFVNVGLGGMAVQLKRRNGHLRDHWDRFVRKLEDCGLVDYKHFHPTGYSYYLHGNVDLVHQGNAFITGDAVGLATRDMCEGIGPAVESGLLAAAAIVSGTEYTLSGIASLSGSTFVSKILESKFAGTGAGTRALP
jgi:flavin-dependent dehydrogenase